ncbi:MAG: c-type cytochrome [Polyangiaceae bacterium]|nr:c-type cytochrome [Polyangiaceae bacterium]
MVAQRLLSFATFSVVLAASSSALADGDPEVGKKLFFERGCAVCHSFDGTAKQGPTLIGIVGKKRQVITSEKPREIIADEEYIRRSVLQPNHDIVQGYVPGAMPGLPITPDEARHLASAIVKLSGSATPEEKPRGSIGALVASTLLFVLGHLVLSSIPVRGIFERRIGVKWFQTIYSILAIASAIWMEMSYRAAPYVELFRAPPWTRWIPLAVMPIALLFFVCSVSTKSPTMAGMEKTVAFEPRGILRITRHPMLWSFALWGFAHIAANGDIASLILFAGITMLAILGMMHIDSRRRVTLGDAWTPFVEKTSLVPFARGNVGKAFAEIGAIRILVSLVVFGAFLHFHKAVIGVSPLP